MTWSKEKKTEYMRAWRDANREQVRENGRRSNKKHSAELALKRALPENREAARTREAAYRARLGPEALRDQRLQQKYGITLEEYTAMLEAQDGYCPICRGPLALLQPHVDHDHEDGRVRGVLCSCCNMALGLLKESPGNLRRMIAYLSKYGKE